MRHASNHDLARRALAVAGWLAWLGTVPTPTSAAVSGNDPAANPFTAPILEARPRVFVRSDDFEGLTIGKLRVALGEPEFAGVRDKWRGRSMGRALRWLTSGNREDLQAAVAGLNRMEAGSDTWSGRGLALARWATLYDWLYAELDEPTRRRIAGRIEQAADAAVEHIERGQAPFFYTRTPGALAGVTLAGLALKGVSPKADRYLEVFRRWGVNEYFKAYDWVEGAATGATYTMYYTYVDLPQICAAWWSATGVNPNDWLRAQQGDWLDGIVRFYLWYLRPGFAFTDINDQFRGVWETHDQFCQGLDVASYVTRNGHGRAWSQRWLGRFGPALYHTEYAHNLIFRDATLAPRPLTELPHAALFGRDSCGYGFFRSSWPAEGQPDTATHVFFRCGDPLDVHGGVAAGEFQVFKHAPLAARSGRYGSYDSPPDQYHRNCISANVVLFTDPAIPGDRGDQHTRRGLKDDHRTWAEWLAIRDRFGLDVARITDWQVKPGEARCRADLTRANPPDKCRRWIREFVWLADRALVVLDIVELARPEIRCQWQLHTPTRPEFGDRLVTVVNQSPALTWAEARLRPESVAGRLFCQTLAPQAYTLLRHSDGKAEAVSASGQPKGPAAGNSHHLKHGRHVLQMEPGHGGTRIAFLNVLTATDAGVALPPQVSYRKRNPTEIEVTVDQASTVLAVPEWFE